MKFSRAVIASIGYELPPRVVSSRALEEQLAPLYRDLRLQPGQLQALTGIRERRFWGDGRTMADGAAQAGRKALAASGVDPADIGLLIYGGVCRDHLEPATACEVAHGLGLGAPTQVYDVSNACLGVLNGIVNIAQAVELGHVRAGLAVSCESARPIVELTIRQLLERREMELLRVSLATLTGGSGAVGVVVCDQGVVPGGHRLLGGVARNNTRHHRLCRWGSDGGTLVDAPTKLVTDASAVLEHGVQLGVETWRAFLAELGWTAESIDRTVCHQVGAPHREAIMKAIGFPKEKDFVTYEFLGNVGTVSLPITAAIAEERGFLERGHRVGMLGIASGLNCLMLGVEW
jgi:3-oxoacyl-[acyl-carrier-protein] synthase III